MNHLPALASEQLLIDHLPQLEGRSAIVVSPGHSQAADFLVQSREFLQVTAWYIDLFAAAVATTQVDSRVQIVCSADLPNGQVDLVLMPVLKRSEAELTRDIMQQAHNRLVQGGWLVMSVDHPTDKWVHEQMQAMFPKVSCQRLKKGCLYWSKKSGELKKLKDFQAEIAYRDQDQLIKAISRPGVFAHRRIDAGARQLLLAAQIEPNDVVLDMGCGSGTVSLAAAYRSQNQVYAVDSNARAVDCLIQSAAINQRTNIQTLLNADGQLNLTHSVDIALANPPYFGDDAIGKHFVDVSYNQLRPGGALLVVTKNPRWYHAYFENRFEDIAIFESGNYYVCCGRKNSS
jgi:16S rRNA (guanine1207-N2)-methyltransferase